MKRIGNAKKEPSDPDFLDLRKARQKAAEQRYAQRVSPGIGWGEWWVALTANRRLTSTKLRRDGLRHDDPRNRYSSPGNAFVQPPATAPFQLCDACAICLCLHSL